MVGWKVILLCFSLTWGEVYPIVSHISKGHSLNRLNSLNEFQCVSVFTLACTHCLSYHSVSLIIASCYKAILYRCGWDKDGLGLNGHGRFSEREGSHGEQRRVVMGVHPALGRRERGLSASTVGDFAMPLQQMGSIVPCCVEVVIMELEGEQGHCSGQSSGDTETLLWVH